jgi:hypothetical protein
MNCRACHGRVLIDRVYSSYNHLELGCLRCGKRWELMDTNNRFISWLIRTEYSYGMAANG